MVAGGLPCLGPVTQSGCGAICPAYDRGCYGCFGPAAQPNMASLTDQLQRAVCLATKPCGCCAASTATLPNSARKAIAWRPPDDRESSDHG